MRVKMGMSSQKTSKKQTNKKGQLLKVPFEFTNCSDWELDRELWQKKWGHCNDNGGPLRWTPENAHNEHGESMILRVFNKFFTLAMESLTTHLQMFLGVFSHRGLRSRSAVGKPRPWQTKHAGAERGQVGPSSLCQVSQEFLGKRTGAAEGQHFCSTEVEEGGVRAPAFVGSSKGQRSHLSHAARQQLLADLQRQGKETNQEWT